MSAMTSHYVCCDHCGCGDGLSATEDEARRMVRSLGWLRVSNGDKMFDMCPDCVKSLMVRRQSPARTLALVAVQP